MENQLYQCALQSSKAGQQENKEVGWQQKEASYTEACSEKERGFNLLHIVLSLLDDFQGALLLKVEGCHL